MDGEVLQVGSKLGRYTLIRRIGAGGMAEVFLASQEGAGGFVREVAIKVVRPGDGEAELMDALADEAQLAAQLAHPNIVQVIDFGMHAAGFYLVMEYLAGLPLERLVGLGGGTGEALALDVVVDVGCQVLDALDFAHTATDSSGRNLAVVHRDVKPANIMVSSIGLVKLLDFGIARAVSIERRTATGMSKGTPAYMAPEQLRGQEVGPAADIFALGVLLFELAVGRSLFTGGSFMELVQRRVEGFNDADRAALRAAQPELLSVVDRALKNDPVDRWPDARSMLNALRLLSDAPSREPLRGWMQTVGTGSERTVPVLSAEDLEIVDPTLVAPGTEGAEAARPGATRPRTDYPPLPKDSTRYESRSDSRPASRLAEEPTAPAGDEQAFPTGDWPGRPSGKSQRIWLGVLALVVGVSVLWLSRGTEQVGPVGGPLPETAAEEAPLLSLPAPELEVVATSDPSSPSDFSTPASLPAPAKKKSLSKAKSVSKPRKAPPTKTSEPQALSGSADEFPLPTEAVGSGVVRVVAVGAGGTVAVDGGERRVLNDAIPIRAGRRKLVVRNKSGRVIVRFEIDVSAGDEQQCVWEEAAGTWGLKRGSEPRCRLR